MSDVRPPLPSDEDPLSRLRQRGARSQDPDQPTTEPPTDAATIEIQPTTASDPAPVDAASADSVNSGPDLAANELDEPADAAPVGGMEPLQSAETVNDVEEAGTDDGEPAESDVPAQQRFGLTPVVSAGLAVLILVAAVLAIGAGLKFKNQNDINTDRPAILSAAVSEVSAITSYNYKKLAADEQKAVAGLAPTFAGSYKSKFVQQVEPLAKKYHVVTMASIDSQYGASVVSQTTADQAVVLIYLDQTTSNTLLKSSRLDRTRAVVTMDKLNGRWMVSKLSTT